MQNSTIMQVVQTLNSFGFQDIGYDKQTKQFHFHNDSDIMNNYVTVMYSKSFRRFNVRIQPVETANIVELHEVEKRLKLCIALVEKLNDILQERPHLETKKLVTHIV